jgi:hypothetical protein
MCKLLLYNPFLGFLYSVCRGKENGCKTLVTEEITVQQNFNSNNSSDNDGDDSNNNNTV